jgi:hypothetical protein
MTWVLVNEQGNYLHPQFLLELSVVRKKDVELAGRIGVRLKVIGPVLKI